MNPARNTRMYDLFKLAVAVILLALVLLFLVSPPGAVGTAALNTPKAVQSVPAAASLTPQNDDSLEPAAAKPTASATVAAIAATTVTAESAAPMQADAQIPEPTLAQTVLPSPTAAAEAEAAETAAPTAASAVQSPTIQPTAQSASVEDDTACAALPSRIQVGDRVRVAVNLHFRSAPGIDAERIRTHAPGISMEVTGGPRCVSFQNGAYRWWQLLHPDGTTGWSAEGSLADGRYFLQSLD